MRPSWKERTLPKRMASATVTDGLGSSGAVGSKA